MADTANAAVSVTRFPVPPQKISCGFYHTVIISNTEHADKTEAWSWGQNQHNVLGLVPADVRKSKDASSQGLFGSRATPTRVSHLKTDIYEVACGTNHTMFLKKKAEEPGGVLWASGLGICGRLGRRNPNALASETEDTEEQWCTESGPLQVLFKWASGTRVLRVVCGADHTICFATDRRLYAWGCNGEGQCGVGGTRHVYEPTALNDFNTKAILHFAAGAQHSLAAAGEGQLYTWGCGRNGRHGMGVKREVYVPTMVVEVAEEKMVYVAGGEAHSGAIDIAGQVWMWGAGSYGRLGLGEEADMLVPKRMAAMHDVLDMSQVAFKSIALGGFHSLFLEAPSTDKMAVSGRIFACGVGAPVGLLSEGDHSVIRVPQPIADKKVFGRQIAQIAAGMFHSAALFMDGTIAAWGVGSQGRLGQYDCKDKPFCGPTYVKMGSALNEKNFYGFNSNNQPLFDESERVVRDKEDKDKKQTGPKKSDWEVDQLACGALHTVARTYGGHVYVWGCNANGQLGVGESTTYGWIPRRLMVANRLVKEVACGAEHCLAVTSTQELYAWGKGTDGQLGTGMARDEFEPQLVDLPKVLTCAAGEMHSAAIARRPEAGSKGVLLKTWGSCESGMLGIGMDYMSGSQTTPMLVEFPGMGGHGTSMVRAGAAGAIVPRPKQASRARGQPPDSEGPAIGPIQVRCGHSHTAVIVGRCDGGGDGHDINQVWTFGGGWYGKLGLEFRDEVTGHRVPNEGTTSNVYAPQQVSLHGNSARDVACGAYHTCMVSDTDELFVWGRKQEVCEPDDLRLPKKFSQIEGQPKIKHVACGDLHTIAVTVAGEVWVWGDNRMGQLGRGVVGREEVRIPIQAKLDPGAVHMLATGPGHTIAQFVNGETHAWGNQSCGRLGLVDKAYEKIVFEPHKVSAVWCSIESRSMNAAAGRKKQHASETAIPKEAEDKEDSDDNEGAVQPEQITELLSDEKVTELSTMQSLLKQEDPNHQEKALEERYDCLRKRLDEIHQDIEGLPGAERDLDRLEAEFDQAFRTNLRWFKVNQPETDTARIDPAFMGRLPVYERLLWVLQQQTTYLSKLAACTREEEEEQILHNTIEAIYGNLDEDRTRNLLLTLLRLVIDGENDSASIEDMFKAGRSKAFRMISEYALSPVHYKDVVYAYFFDGQIIEGVDTLFKAIRGTSDRSETFALSLSDFREACGDDELKKKEDQDLRAAFVQSTHRFSEFLVDPFVKAVKGLHLPKDIRQILRHALQAVNNRQFALSTDPSITPELRKCEPLLRLFCLGILAPLLRNPTKYASSQCFLEKSGEIIKSDTLIAWNMSAIADFLEHMLENKFDSKQKILKSAVRVLKPELLKYLKKQAEVSCDLETELLVDTYLMHFDRSKHMVRMTSVDLMKLSNMLKTHMAKLRIQENDELESLCSQLLEWGPDKIMMAERQSGCNVVHNFSLDPRFMFQDTESVICGVSNCLMPIGLCGSLYSKEIIKAYSASEDSENPRRVLEMLFRQLDQIKSKTFKDMQAEFESLRAAERLKSPPSYEMMQNLSKGVKMVGEMLNVEVSPQDLINFMAEQLVTRAKYSQYLGNIENGLKDIYKKRDKYRDSLKGWTAELEAALSAAVSLKLPEPYIKHGGTNIGRSLAFDNVNRKMEARRNLGVADPGQMREIGCSYSPMETYAVSKLQRTGVIVKVHPPFSAMQKKMKVTIRALANGGVELIVNVVQGKHQTQVKTMSISEDRLTEMKRAEKTEHTDIPSDEDPFLTCVSSAFTQLVCKVRENTA